MLFSGDLNNAVRTRADRRAQDQADRPAGRSVQGPAPRIARVRARVPEGRVAGDLDRLLRRRERTQGAHPPARDADERARPLLPRRHGARVRDRARRVLQDGRPRSSSARRSRAHRPRTPFFGFERTAFGCVRVRTDGEHVLVFTDSGERDIKEIVRLRRHEPRRHEGGGTAAASSQLGHAARNDPLVAAPAAPGDRSRGPCRRAPSPRGGTSRRSGRRRGRGRRSACRAPRG